MSDLRTYVIRRRSAWASADEVEVTGARSADVADNDMPDDIRWIRTYIVDEPDGLVGTVCIYQASTPGKVIEHAVRTGMPADEITEVVDTVLVRPDPAVIEA
jgi:hypothetical protein